LETIISEQRENIRIITLNRPERLNAVNKALTLALRDALINANADESVKVIVLRGAGRAFCSGDDLDETMDESGSAAGLESIGELVVALQDITRQIVTGDKFVVGAIQGWAVGAGFEWAINCDFAIWAEDARAYFPEMRWGLFPTGGITSLLPRIVGLTKARELLLLGEKHNAQQLLDMGIAWRVVPEPRLMDEVMTVAEKIAGLPAHVVRSLKRTINAANLADLEAALLTEQEALMEAVAHPDTLKLLKEF